MAIPYSSILANANSCADVTRIARTMAARLREHGSDHSAAQVTLMVLCCLEQAGLDLDGVCRGVTWWLDREADASVPLDN